MAVWIAVAVAAVVVIGGGVTAATFLNSSEQAPIETVTLEPAATPGTDPFLASVSVTEVTAFPDSVQAVAATTADSMTTNPTTGTLTIAGTAENLYGGNQSESTELYGGSGKLAECDVAELADYLAGHPDKATAWAGVRGIAPSQIADYLKTLTPVVLLQDTLVTNFGFTNGGAVPRQSVLQSGTGVLVDWTGQPVVRCACGNPLATPATTNLSTAQLLGTRWDGYDPARTVVVTGGPVTAGFVLVDVVTGQSFTRPVGITAPTPASSPPPATTALVPTTAAAPTATALTPTTATSGAECAFDLKNAEGGQFGSRAWVESDPAENMSCADMIARWRQYENWTGPVAGQVGRAEFGDGWMCDTSWVPLTMPEYIDGSVGHCSNGPDSPRETGSATVTSLTIWYGEYGEHKVAQTTAAPKPAPAEPAPAGVCNDGTLKYEPSAENDGSTTCEEWIALWHTFMTEWREGRKTYDSGWTCFIPSGNDPGECNKGPGTAFFVGSYNNGEESAGSEGPGSGDAGADGTGAGRPTGDLGLSVALTRPACDGMGIVVLFSATTPGAYEAEVQQALDDHPGSSYLRTDQSCSSLNQSYQGNPIYAVYQTAGYDQGGLCSAAGSLGGYARWLDNTSDPNTSPCG